MDVVWDFSKSLPKMVERGKVPKLEIDYYPVTSKTTISGRYLENFVRNDYLSNKVNEVVIVEHEGELSYLIPVKKLKALKVGKTKFIKVDEDDAKSIEYNETQFNWGKVYTYDYLVNKGVQLEGIFTKDNYQKLSDIVERYPKEKRAKSVRTTEDIFYDIVTGLEDNSYKKVYDNLVDKGTKSKKKITIKDKIKTDIPYNKDINFTAKILDMSKSSHETTVTINATDENLLYIALINKFGFESTDNSTGVSDFWGFEDYIAENDIEKLVKEFKGESKVDMDDEVLFLVKGTGLLDQNYYSIELIPEGYTLELK